jgi:hypothetical protein
MLHVNTYFPYDLFLDPFCDFMWVSDLVGEHFVIERDFYAVLFEAIEDIFHVQGDAG